MEKVDSYVAQIYLTIGRIQGKTLLPLPVRRPGEISAKARCQLFESRIITWTKQIKKVLDTEPEHILKENPTPDPFCELRFWEQKAENLNSIAR